MKKIVTFSLILVLAQISFGQTLSDKFDALMSEQFKPNEPGGVALIMKEGKVLYRKAFGMANLEMNIKMKPDHVFRIGSITKQFTATAILKLRDEGKINLDDDITKYITDYPSQGNKITIKHLLTHTSGIKSYTAMNNWDAEVRKKDFTPKEMIAFFKNEPMNFKPGEAYRYSNSGYFLLGHIIEVVSGKSYKDYIENMIFNKLKMSNSYYNSPSRVIKNRIPGYKKENGEFLNADFVSMSQPFSAGALLTTVDDLYTWNNAVINHEIISKDSRKEAHSTFILNNGEKTGYGYGWMLGNIEGSPMINHGGGIDGFLSMSMYLEKEKVFVVVLSNCTCNPPWGITQKMATLAIEKNYELKAITLADDLLKSYEGIYESDKNGQQLITFKDGSLYAQKQGERKFKIYPFEKDKFFFKGVPGRLEFSRNNNNEIISVTLKSVSYDTTWKRTNKPLSTIK